MKLTALVAVAVLALAGCSTSTPAAKDPPVATTAAATTAAAAQDATALAGPLDGLPSVTKVVTITEGNDPTGDIGRPGGYVSAAVIYDKTVKCDGKDVVVGCGAKIEVFASAAQAKTRAAQIQALAQSVPSFGGVTFKEYGYLRGPALLRVSGEVKPSLAKAYNAAFGGTPVVS